MNPEIAVLSQLIQNDQLYYQMNLTEHHFADPKHKRLFREIERMVAGGIKVDQVSISENIPPVDVVSVSDAVPTTANWSYYHGQLQEQYKKRIAWEMAQHIQAQLKDGVESAQIFQAIEQKMQEATARGTRYLIERIGDTLIDFVNLVEERYKAKGEIPGIKSGFPKLDKMVLGWQPRRHYIIGARPSRGKTAFLLNCARKAALDGVPCGLISLESAKEEVDARVIADIASIDSQRLVTGLLGLTGFSQLTDAAGQLNDAPLYIYDEPNADLATVRAQMRRMVRQYGVRVIFLDYIQIIGHIVPGGKEHEVYKEISKSMKQIARDLNIAVVSAAQLSRDSQNRRPHIGDVYGSSQFEKDADVIVLIHHEMKDDELSNSWLLVDKNRDGKTGSIPVYFKPEYVRFHEREEV